MPSGSRSSLLGSALLTSLFVAALAGAQNAPKHVTGNAPAHRMNELRLAGLRPGRDTASKAFELYGKPNGKDGPASGTLIWGATCQTQTLSIDVDDANKIQVIRTSGESWGLGDCAKLDPKTWRTGNGLRVGDPIKRRRKVQMIFPL